MSLINLLRTTVVARLRPNARNALAIALLLSGHDRWPRPIDDWPQRRVVVISPHPDDEAIGCAGAVLLHLAAGAQVHVVHVSDGRNGSRALQQLMDRPAELAEAQRALIATRRAEAELWAAQAGVSSVQFLNVADGAIGPSPSDAAALTRLLDAWAPDLIYLPALTDVLEDHWQTNLLLEAALARSGARWVQDLLMRSYEVWSPLPANRTADITQQMERKLALLDVYQSQLVDVDYRRAVAGLNTYRAMMLPATGVGHAEAFLETSMAGWQEIMARRA